MQLGGLIKHIILQHRETYLPNLSLIPLTCPKLSGAVYPTGLMNPSTGAPLVAAREMNKPVPAWQPSFCSLDATERHLPTLPSFTEILVQSVEKISEPALMCKQVLAFLPCPSCPAQNVPQWG